MVKRRVGISPVRYNQRFSSEHKKGCDHAKVEHVTFVVL